MERQRIVLRSYDKVWKIEKKVYKIQNFKLPIPIKPLESGYFLAILVVVLILQRIIHGFSNMPEIVKYGVLPYVGMKFLLKKKLDGKAPQKFLLDYLLFVLYRKKRFERFKVVERPKTLGSHRWRAAFRDSR